jgi:hypothetical protein
MLSEPELAEFMDSMVAMLQAFYAGEADRRNPNHDFDDDGILARVCAAMVHVRKYNALYTQHWPALASAVAGAIDAAGGELSIAQIMVLRDCRRRVRAAASAAAGA